MNTIVEELLTRRVRVAEERLAIALNALTYYANHDKIVDVIDTHKIAENALDAIARVGENE